VEVRAVAHVTGGGLMENLSRVLPEGVRARVDRSAWDVPQVQALLIERGGIAAAEAERVFNLGIGMVVVVPAASATAAVAAFASSGVDARVIGQIAAA
jgi:phosphoribosylformylglycinamidine cyclo-ligase